MSIFRVLDRNGKVINSLSNISFWEKHNGYMWFDTNKAYNNRFITVKPGAECKFLINKAFTLKFAWYIHLLVHVPHLIDLIQFSM